MIKLIKKYSRQINCWRLYFSTKNKGSDKQFPCFLQVIMFFYFLFFYLFPSYFISLIIFL